MPPTPSDGFFVVNEGRFGKDNRWVNYFKYNNGTYDPSYRVYRVANPGDKLGVTSQFATIWGNHAYFCSNQGNRSGKIYLCIDCYFQWGMCRENSTYRYYRINNTNSKSGRKLFNSLEPLQNFKSLILPFI